MNQKKVVCRICHKTGLLISEMALYHYDPRTNQSYGWCRDCVGPLTGHIEREHQKTMKQPKKSKTPTRPSPVDAQIDEAGSRGYAEATQRLFTSEFGGKWSVIKDRTGWWHCEEA